MPPIPFPDHLLSLDEWAALPEDDSRHYELWEGRLLAGPRPEADHQLALAELGFQLRDRLPGQYRVVPQVEVVTSTSWPPTVRVPDLVVVSKALLDTNPQRCQAADVLLAVEVTALGSRQRDRLVKFFEYAEAGIPRYWIIDLADRVTLSAYDLVEGEYKLVAEGSGTLQLHAPTEVTVDVAALR